MANEQNLTDQELVRREKMEALRAKGIDPFGHAFKRTTYSSPLKKEFEDKTKEELQELDIHALCQNVVKVKLDSCIFKINLDNFKYM